MKDLIDYLVIGAGAAGCSIAYFLQQAGKEIVLVDQGALCGGASGAAGAFLSPLLGKPNPYKTFVNDALGFSLDIYKAIVPDALIQEGVLRIPKDDDDLEKFASFAEFMDVPFEKRGEGYFFPDGGLVDPKEICRIWTKDIAVRENFTVTDLEWRGAYWQCGGISAKHIVLATGAYKEILSIPYINIRRIYGCRFNVNTSYCGEYNIHKDMSISCALENGITAIGATHVRDVAYEGKQIPDLIDTSLVERAAKVVDLGAYEIVQSFAGIRAASPDYFPIIGGIVDTEKTLAEHPDIRTGTRIPPKLLTYLPNLTIHTGHGARAFVLAPYTAKILSDFLTANQTICDKLDTKRLFYKWARKNQT
jgi:glycine/D-amino acid oxidase-like deaminating enzyme